MLKDDLPTTLEGMRAALLEAHRELSAVQSQSRHEAAVLAATVEQQQGIIAKQEQTIVELLAALRGKRRERIDPNQLLLLDVGELEALVEEQARESPRRQRRKHGRRLLPDNLPHEEVLHELPEAQRLCPHDGRAMQPIRYEISKQLDYEPAKLKVIVHKRAVYACAVKHDEATLRTAPQPAQPIAKGLPGPGLLAALVLGKFGDHRVQGEAVFKMRVGLSQSDDRIWLQTSPNCDGKEPSWEASGAKGADEPRQVRFAKSNASEPLMKCRNRTNDVKTGGGDFPGISMGSACFLARAASGIKAARSRIRLGNGTLEPVASMRREKLKRSTRKSESTNARHRGGTTRSSDEGREIRLERRSRVIQSSDNRSTASAGGTHA